MPTSQPAGYPKKIIEEDMEISFYSTGSVNLVDMETVKFMSAAGKMGTVGEMGTKLMSAAGKMGTVGEMGTARKHFVATAGTKK